MDFLRKKDLGQPPVDSVKDGLEASGDIEFPEDAGQMTVHCFFTDGEVLGDFFIGAASSEVT